MGSGFDGFGTTTTTTNASRSSTSSSHSSSGGSGGGTGSSGGGGAGDVERQRTDDISEPPPPPRDSKRPQSGAGSSSNSSPPAKKSRRSLQKRVVTVPIADLDGGSRPKGSGEGAPPPDSWAWRKYGQKPIKGSPYPRGYYRCSSSKGCPARKQVERSRVDPTVLVVTYASDHNHPWPLPKNQQHHHHHHHNAINSSTSSNGGSQKPNLVLPPEGEKEEEAPLATTPPLLTSGPGTPVTTTNTSSSSREEASFSADLGEESSLMLVTASADELCWYPDMTETSLHSDLAMMLPVSYDEVAVECGGSGGSGGVKEEEEQEDDEDSLFAGLGELPGCSVVLRRGPGGRGCSLAAASWCGNSG